MYRYYSPLRLVSIGTFPEKDCRYDIVNFERRHYILDIGKNAWGYIEYEQPLTAKEARDYDLVPSP